MLFFTEIKNGVVLDSIQLHVGLHVVGRDPACAILLAHASISRQHATVDVVGEQRENRSKEEHLHEKLLVYLTDSSTHGTFVNKVKLQLGVRVKLRIGDSVKFGQSERIYVLETDEVEQETKPAKMVKQKVEKVEENREDAHSMQDYAWGMVQSEDHDQRDYLAWLDQARTGKIKVGVVILEKIEKLVETLERQEKRLESAEKEMRDIRKKQEKNIHENLFADKQKEVAKNIAGAEIKIDALHEEIRNAIDDASGHLRRPAKVTINVSDDDDEFYDRTASMKKESAANVVENEQSLLGKVGLLSKRIAQIVEKRDDLLVMNEKTDEDELDSFMAELDKNSREIEVKKLTVQLDVLEQELQRAHSLLKLIQVPKTKMFPASVEPFGRVVQEIATVSTQIAFEKPIPKVSIPDPVMKKPAVSVEPLPVPHKVPLVGPMLPPTRILASDKIKLQLDQPDDLMPVVPSDTIEEVTTFAGKSSFSNLNALLPDSGKGGLLLRKSKNTEAILELQAKKKKRSNAEGTQLVSAQEFESNWKPPQNQKGDGMTNLNAKFGY